MLAYASLGSCTQLIPVAYQLTHPKRNNTAQAEIFDAYGYFLIDTIDDIMAKVKSVKEVDKLLVIFLAQRTVIIVHGEFKVIGPDEAIDVPAKCQLFTSQRTDRL